MHYVVGQKDGKHRQVCICTDPMAKDKRLRPSNSSQHVIALVAQANGDWAEQTIRDDRIRHKDDPRDNPFAG